ncbi:helix-turn-helix domain-containing protein [Niallia taxi]|uniref:helix-turn-helix domain-containing protein n=1 Tax=Niallia taxi TaxID=2499688 RepID=UPI0011A4F2F9
MDQTFREIGLEFGCNLINEITNIPISVLDKQGKLILNYSSNLPHNPMFSSNEEHLKSINLSEKGKTLPIMCSTIFQEQFVLIPIVQNHTYIGTIFLGPTVVANPSEAMLNNRFYANDLGELTPKVKDYFSFLPVISKWKLIKSSILLSYVLFKEKFDMSEIMEINLYSIDSFHQHQVSDKSISDLRQNSSFHHDPAAEKKLYQYITDGNKEDLIIYYKAFHRRSDFEFGVLSKQCEIRSHKNLKIAGITLATRAAIAGGLNPEIAYTLGDKYIQDIEELHTIKEVETLTESAYLEFAERVYKGKRQQSSKTISDCKHYIFKYIYENISLAVLADYVSMNPKYLSNLFKKEVGISVTEYIQQSKIDEAIKLMIFSNYSLSEIYTLLNFTDQSYFTKVFKKFTGFTPKQYIKNNIGKEKNLNF